MNDITISCIGSYNLHYAIYVYKQYMDKICALNFTLI